MSYQLDTNVVVDVLRQGTGPVQARLRAALPCGVAISSVLLFELWYGVARSADPARNATLLRTFLSGPIDILPFEAEDAAVAGELRAALEAAGRVIGPFDLLLAAQALRAGATLVTANRREFSRISRLPCEDWSRRQ